MMYANKLKWVTQAQSRAIKMWRRIRGSMKKKNLNDANQTGRFRNRGQHRFWHRCGADVALNGCLRAFGAREKGLPNGLYRTPVPFKSLAWMLTCRKDAGIERPTTFKGKTWASGFFGKRIPFP